YPGQKLLLQPPLALGGERCGRIAAGQEAGEVIPALVLRAAGGAVHQVPARLAGGRPGELAFPQPLHLGGVRAFVRPRHTSPPLASSAAAARAAPAGPGTPAPARSPGCTPGPSRSPGRSAARTPA